MKGQPSKFLEDRRKMGERGFNDGLWILPIDPDHEVGLKVIASDGMDWDHVSVSVVGAKRLPTWAEMQWVKRQFFKDTETVIQYHVPEGEHIDIAEVLHMWRPHNETIPMPPRVMV